jgi:hypothetical protein
VFKNADRLKMSRIDGDPVKNGEKQRDGKEAGRATGWEAELWYLQAAKDERRPEPGYKLQVVIHFGSCCLMNPDDR